MERPPITLANGSARAIPPGVAWRLAAWITLSVAVFFITFNQRGVSLGKLLSIDWVFDQHHAAGWGVLALCAGFLCLNGRTIWAAMREPLFPRRLFWAVPAGIAIAAAAVITPSTPDFFVLQVLAASLGIAIILFGRAAFWPGTSLAVYALAIGFPVLVRDYAASAYSQLDLMPLGWLASVTGFPVQITGSVLGLTTLSNETIRVVLTTDCAGPATMGVFLGIFCLMMLDRPLPGRTAAWVFAVGVAGTWFQALLRIIILLLAGYFWNEEALWTAHYWTIYILFPLWYLLFAFIYFRRRPRVARASS